MIRLAAALCLAAVPAAGQPAERALAIAPLDPSLDAASLGPTARCPVVWQDLRRDAAILRIAGRAGLAEDRALRAAQRAACARRAGS